MDDAIRRGTHLTADPDRLRLYDIRNTIAELDRVYTGKEGEKA